MSGHLHLFLSAVSNEFRDYREALRGRLDRPNLTIKIQEDFIASGSATLLKLDEYIQNCEAVVHLLGDMIGSPPDASEVKALLERYPDLPKRLPALEQSFAESIPLSYTQWEAYLAAFHRRTLLIAEPTLGAERAAEYVADPEQQQAQHEHVRRLRKMGKHVEIKFGSQDGLGLAVLNSTLLEPLIRAGPPTKPVLLPFTSRGALFRGREDDLGWLEEQFETEDSSLQSVTAAFCGLGGIGKTRLAVEYAHRRREQHSAVLLVSVSGPELLQSGLAELTRMLRLPERDVTDIEAQVAAVLNWLQTHPGWLLILDNIDSADTAAEVTDILPRLHGGAILITGRYRTWPPEIAFREVGLWTHSEACDFLLARTDSNPGRRPSDDDEQHAGELAEQLGYLPLALEQAGAYICKHRLRLADYRQQWEAQRERVLNWHDGQTMNYPASVAITWQTSFSQLSDSARDLLHRLAWLSPQPVPENLLDIRYPGRAEEDLREALAELESYSLVTRDSDEPYFSVHRLVQEISRQDHSNDENSSLIEKTLRWVTRAFDGDPQDVSNWPVLVPLAAHAEAVATFADRAEIVEPTARLMNELGILFEEQAQYKRSEPLKRRALAIDEQRLGPEHPSVAIRLSNLAALLQHTDRITEAEPLMRRALAIDENSFGPEHPKVVTRLNNLALLLQATNRLGEAETMMRRALAISEHSFGPDDPRVATQVKNLAGLLQATNRLQEAEPMMRRALALGERKFGPDHPNVAHSLGVLASLLRETSRVVEAESLMRRALEIDERSFGPKHPRVATQLNNLAGLLKATNRLDEAEPLMRRVLAIDEKTFGPKHPDVARDLNNLALLLQTTKRLAEAEPLMRRALAIHEQSFGPEHPKVAVSLNSLAQLLQDTNQIEEAEPLMRRALTILEQSFGPEHPDVAGGLNNLALLLRDHKRPDEVEPLMRRMIKIFVEFTHRTGHPHPNLKAALRNYSVLLREMGQSEKQIDATLRELRALIAEHVLKGKG